MSNLSTADKKYLENALRLDSSPIVHFDFYSFFKELGIDIDNPKYASEGTTKTALIRKFWKLENNTIVGRSILELASLFRNQELRGPMFVKFSTEIEKIGQKLMMYDEIDNKPVQQKKRRNNNELKIELRPEIYKHVKRFMDNEDYFHAVEEGYKIVRHKLQELTGEEQAHRAFAEQHYESLFGHQPQNTIERDFFEGIKFLNMAIQNFLNEKAHDIAKPLNRNIAIHYLALTSLAYDLITRNE
nr:MAG TPA: TIGR02391 family protein [Caudoviricetes sp.]